MAKRRRIAWIVVGLLIIGLAGGGLWWYHRQNSGLRLLRRARLAISAGKLQKAQQLAQKYVQQDPNDWRGRHILATAYRRQGMHQQARLELTEAIKLKPKNVDIVIDLARTYSQTEASPEALPNATSDPNDFRQIIEGLAQAENLLAKFEPDPNDRPGLLRLQSERGIGLYRTSRLQLMLAESLEAKAKVAEAVHKPFPAAAYRMESRTEQSNARKSRELAIPILLAVIRENPSLAAAGEALLELCFQSNDKASLELARTALNCPGKASPTAAVRLARYDLNSAMDAMGNIPLASQRRITKRVQDILDAHPNNGQAKCLRGNLALMGGDCTLAEKLSQEVLDADPHNFSACLLHAQALMAAGKSAEAEKELFSLKTRLPGWLDAQYWYARAAREAGKDQLAKDAMRAVTDLGKDVGKHKMGTEAIRLAHQHRAEQLIRDFPAQALEEARACYDADPNQPASVALLVRAAMRNNQPHLAREVLAKARINRPRDPQLLSIVRNGLLAIGDPNQAREVASQAAEIVPTGANQATAVADALTFLGRDAEADLLLMRLVEADPNNPDAQLALARRYATSGRQYQAVDHCRKALKLCPNTLQCRLALAKALVSIHELDEARDLLEPILMTSREAQDIEADINDLQGKPQDENRVFAADRRRTGRALANACIRGGQVDRGIELCLAELKRDPAAAVGWHRLLGQAYLMQGKIDECVEAWAAGIKAYPLDLSLYLKTASVLGRQMEPEKLAKRLSDIDGAKTQLVDLAVAAARAGLNQYAKAAELYGKVADDNSVSKIHRYHARIEQAKAMARDGKVDLAIAELDKLIKAGDQPTRTAMTKVGLLASVGRTDDAVATLSDLLTTARNNRNALLAFAAAKAFMQLRKFDNALAACEVVQALRPEEPKSYFLRAMICQQTGRDAEAVDLYRKAVDLQPTQLGYQLALAEALDARQEPRQAMDTLRKMEALSQPAKLDSILRQGVLLKRWGLNDEAARRMEPLLEFAHAPRERMLLAAHFASIDRKDKARELLAMVPRGAPQYLIAQLMLADLAETPKDKLALLAAITGADPNSDAMLNRRMSAMMDDNRNRDAIDAFAQAIGSPRPLPTAAAQAVTAALKLGDLSAARMGASVLADVSGQPAWQTVVDEINIELDPDKAGKSLPSPKDAHYIQAAMGLCLGKQTGNAETTRLWTERLAEFGRDKPDNRPANLRLICALLVGNSSGIQAAADALTSTSSNAAQAAAELCKHAAQDPADNKTTRQLLDLLRAEVALMIRRPEFASFWALRALEARPKCQWAAMQIGFASGLAAIFGTPLGPEAKQRAAELLEPRDCLLALELRADACMRTGQFDQAAGLYAELAEADKGKGQSAWCRHQAGALERAGNPDNAAQYTENIKKALDLYHKAYIATKAPSACNNWAYLVCDVYPQNKAMLDEAQKAMAELESRKSFRPGYLDTSGWIAFRQGRTADACRLLNQAVKIQPDSAEVHYHLGMAENAAGNKNLAKMHLERAVTIVEEKRKTPPSDPANKLLPAEAQAAARAETALAGMSTMG